MNSKKAVALRWIWPLIVSAAATNCLDDQSPLPTRVLLQSQSELTKAENSTGTPFMVLDVWDETHPTHSTFVEHFFGAIGLLLTVSLAIYLKFIVEDYEEKTSANSPPWFCDERIIVQVGGGFVLAWVVIGVMVFTQVLSFSVLGKERNLTALEALYVCAEILTTVGYGDVSPSSYASQAFCAVYSILGCSLIAVVFSLLFNHYLGTQRHLVPLTHPAVGSSSTQQAQIQGCDADFATCDLGAGHWHCLFHLLSR